MQPKKIEFVRTTIRFKSTPENYEKESTDLKCNTVRDTTDWTIYRWEIYGEATHVIIVNRDNTKQESKRLISDKTSFDKFVIISWLPDNYNPCHTTNRNKLVENPLKDGQGYIPEKSTQLKTEREHGKDSTLEGEEVFEYAKEFDKENSLSKIWELIDLENKILELRNGWINSEWTTQLAKKELIYKSFMKQQFISVEDIEKAIDEVSYQQDGFRYLKVEKLKYFLGLNERR
jgi:hypothetical protein